GGWSDYVRQRPERVTQTVAAQKAAPKAAAAENPVTPNASALSFTERKRLADLPAQIEKLGAEIARLSDLLAQADLFEREPVKFRKASEMLAEREAALAAVEEEWLDLAERDES